MKGIAEQDNKPSRGNKKKNEEKRIRDLVEQQLEQERRVHRQSMEKMQQDLNYMQEQLYEEQRQREVLENELCEYKAFAEVGFAIVHEIFIGHSFQQMKNRRHDSEVDSISLDARNNSSMLSSSQCSIAQNQPAVQDPQRSLMEVRMDSKAFIRLPTSNKRKTQWSQISAHLSGAWLVFYKLQNGRCTSQPVIQIDTRYRNLNPQRIVVLYLQSDPSRSTRNSCGYSLGGRETNTADLPGILR